MSVLCVTYLKYFRIGFAANIFELDDEIAFFHNILEFFNNWLIINYSTEILYYLISSLPII
jgi:hypothetical protein